jgi:hypothetical protein
LYNTIFAGTFWTPLLALCLSKLMEIEMFRRYFDGDREGICFIIVSIKQLTTFSQQFKLASCTAHSSFFHNLQLNQTDTKKTTLGESIIES